MQAKEWIENIREGLTDKTEQATYSTRRTAKKVNGYVRKNPWKIIGFASSIGFLAGWLTKLRVQSDSR